LFESARRLQISRAPTGFESCSERDAAARSAPVG
jgi:hypothetical protein